MFPAKGGGIDVALVTAAEDVNGSFAFAFAFAFAFIFIFI